MFAAPIDLLIYW